MAQSEIRGRAGQRIAVRSILWYGFALMIGSISLYAHPRHKGGVLFFLLSAVAFWGARAYFSQHGQLLEVARAQVWAFPLFVIAVAAAISTIPRWLSLLALLTGLGTVGYSYNYYSYVDRSIILGPLASDAMASQTRITRTMLEQQAHAASGPAVAAIYNEISNHESALHVLEQNPNALAVVWGNTRWINVARTERVNARSLKELGGKWLSVPSAIRVITEVPSFGISYRPVQDTTRFLSLVFSDSESAVKAASELVAPWTTFAHRGYAYLRLGNMYLNQALEAQSYQYGLIDCAIDAYQEGWVKVGAKDNVELKSALLNNLAAATLIRAAHEKDRAARIQATRWFRAAGRTARALRRKKGIYYAPQVSLSNFKVVRASRTRRTRKSHVK